jgi:hypothetical protein
MCLIQSLVSALLAILFLQSGMDKVTDRKGNLEWLTGHFANSPLAGMVPLLLTTLTLVEIAAGGLSLIGVAFILVSKTYCMAFAGTAVSGIALVMLFFGQRLAKDYAGAASLIPYFLLVIIDLYFLA